MIYINRNTVDDTGVAINPGDDWFQLASTATETAIEERGNHTADKSVYAHTEVRRALEALFHDKCAYCETKMSASADWDVDHFRPKGRVAERRDHPGYYWLVYSWENLYSSCQHCNQLRKDRPRWADPVELPAQGKADRFPLEDESSRAMSPADRCDDEARLLIDPCSDDPAEYLGYDITGDVLPLDDNSRGKATIRVLHLSRRRLRDARRAIVRAALDLLKLISSEITTVAARNDLQTFLDNRFKADECEYAAVVRYVENHPSDFGMNR